MPGQLKFDFRFSTAADKKAASADSPMRILMVGNFSGHRHPDAALKNRTITGIDIDNFNEVMFRLSPALNFQDLQTEVVFHCLDDFHPDHLYKELDVFHRVTQLRQSLQNPATFAQTAAKLMGTANVPDDAGQSVEPAPAEDQNALFERLLGKAPAQQPHLQSSLDHLFKNIIAPHIVEKIDPRQPELIAEVDRATSALMRSLLHHPDFQSLEALWRSAYELVSRLETGESLQLYLLEISQAELAQDLLSAGENLETSAVYQLLARQHIDQPWSVIIGDYTFVAARQDVQTLSAMGAIAAHMGTPFLAAADSSLLGCASLAQPSPPSTWNGNFEFMAVWQALREKPYARWLGLALPRILLRLPYGRKTDPIDSFEFEELTMPDEHEAFLWGNPAFACARLLAENFQETGWPLSPDRHLNVDDLPAYSYKQDGETRMQACAEWYLPEATAEAMLERGVMPLLSYRNRNCARLLRFQSIAAPLAGLAGICSRED
ncbi:type VI secretion system contractile sheath domain-containing protein [Methylobacter sp.]|uniref:type VI secretion system contractile sheath domain-containing protein n=1 Tax=Methylobacter sp. TaxID=2051955 RepID=UPI003DA5612D